MNSQHKVGTGALVILLALILFGFVALVGRVDRTLIGPEIVVRRATVEGVKTENASVSVPYTRDSDRYAIINVAIDFNRDGAVAAYGFDEKMQEEWVIRNMPSRVLAHEGNSFGFALVDKRVEERRDFPLVVLLTKNTLAAWDGSERSGSAMQTLIVGTVEPDEVRPRFKPDPTGLRSGGLPVQPLAPNFADAPAGGIPDRPSRDVLGEVRTGASEPALTNSTVTVGDTAGPATLNTETPPVSQSFNVFHGDVPDISQGENECVPTATANSLRWLAQENNFEDRLPPDDLQVINELKNDLNWSSFGVYVERDYLSGKRAFTTRHDIPIETHPVGGTFDPDIVALIAEELRQGQDVEIDMEYGVYAADGSYHREGGHMLTVVGAHTEETGQYLDVHDPLSPGPGRLDIYRIDTTRVENYRYQGNTTTYLRQAYAESPIPLSPPATTVSPPDTNLFFDVEPNDFSFTHQIGLTQCPTPIGQLRFSATGELTWEIETNAAWLAVSEPRGTVSSTPKEVNLSFNCVLATYTSQTLTTELTIRFSQDNELVGVKKVTIDGKIQE